MNSSGFFVNEQDNGRLGGNPHHYDWYVEVGHRDYSDLTPGRRVLYEEHALFPELDEGYYHQRRSIVIPPTVSERSSRGFIKIDPSDDFWIDPRDRNRRIYETTIGEVTAAGEIRFGTGGGNPIISRRCVVDVLPRSAVPACP